MSTLSTQERQTLTSRTYNNQPVVQGICTYPSAGGDNDVLFYYSDGYFMESPQKYNDHLATLSANMAHAAMNSCVGIKGDNGNYTFKGKNIHQMMIDMGCKNSDITLSDTYTKKPQMDSIGYCIASKDLPNNEKLVIIAVRGGGYEAEWASNVTLGASGEHKGFATAASKVFSGLNDYLSKKNIDGTSSKTKFWIAGYSRAGATSNLTATRIIAKFDNSGARTFAYPIEAPKGGLESEKKKGCNYDCIHNVVNYRDIVPWVAMGKLGFIRYGKDHFLPGTNVANKYTEGVPHDNYTEILGTDTYEAQKQKMLTQLARINRDAVYEYDDTFEAATIEIVKGITGFSDIISTKGVKPKKVEDWIPTFFDNFTEWIFGSDNDIARLSLDVKNYLKSTNKRQDALSGAPLGYKLDAHGSKSFQESLRALMELFMAPSEKSDKFTSALGKIDVLDDIGVVALVEIYFNVLNKGLAGKVVTNPYAQAAAGGAVSELLIPGAGPAGSVLAVAFGPKESSDPYEDTYNAVWPAVKKQLLKD